MTINHVTCEDAIRAQQDELDRLRAMLALFVTGTAHDVAQWLWTQRPGTCGAVVAELTQRINQERKEQGTWCHSVNYQRLS